MKPITDSLPASADFLPPVVTQEQAENRTKLTGREMPGALIPEMRYQLGKIVFAPVHVRHPALQPAGYHDEDSARFFKFIAWGSSWAAAAANWQRNYKREDVK